MMSKLIDFLVNRIRPEFTTSLMVVLYSSILTIVFAGLSIAFDVFEGSFVVNYQFIGIFTGCIGFGELIRAFWKLNVSVNLRDNIYASNALAGSGCIGSFSIIVHLIHLYPLWTIPFGFIIGAVFYIVLIKAAQFDNWFYNRT